MSEPSDERDPFGLSGVTIESKYRVASVVGDGGFGVVYRGVHKGFGELIAIKCLKLPDDLKEAERERLLERLREEGRLLHRLSRVTSGIVQALDVGAITSPNGSWVPFLVLEWLEGQTLGAYMREQFKAGKRFSLEEALQLLEPAARALAVAHEQKVAHRDVKPANLFITEVGGRSTMKVLDFGIAKVLSEHRDEHSDFEVTALTPTAFTPRYGAPEQFNKKRGASGPWTDVFALALILVEIVSGKKALDGDDPTQLYVAATDPQERPTLRARGVQVSQAVEDVLARALEVDPRHRYRSAGDFWDALTRAAGVSGRLASDPALIDPASPLMAPELQSETQSTKEGGAMGHSPTLPAESLERNGTGDKAAVATAEANAPAAAEAKAQQDNPSSPSSPRPASSPDTKAPTRTMAAVAQTAAGSTSIDARDPMEETPEGARVDAGAEPLPPPPAIAPTMPPSSKPRKSSPLLWVSLVVLLGGAAFAYTTIFSDPNVGPRPPRTGPDPTTSASGDSAPITSAVAPSASVPAPLPSFSAAPAVLPPPPEDMVRIEAAKFRMGGDGAAAAVEISKPFYVDRYEVSVRAYAECVDAGRCTDADTLVVDTIPEGVSKEDFVDTWKRRCNAERDAKDHPINCVSFADARDYCAFRDRRLPTEAEWELAARGDRARRFPWGGAAPSCEAACFDRNRACMVIGELVATCGGGTHPKDKTPEGVYDMAGNVAEWTQDGWGPIKGGVDPSRRASGSVVVRGGSFLDEENALELAHRTRIPANTQHVNLGFRCALDAPEPPEEEGEDPGE